MSNLSLLLLDTSGRTNGALTASLDTFRVLHATSLAMAQDLLRRELVAMVVMPYPQPGLTVSAAHLLVAEHPAATLWLLYEGNERPQEVLGERVYTCRYEDAPLLLGLAGRLAATEGALQRAQQQLYANAGAVALSGIIGGVAHDINNALTVVVGNGELLPPQASLDDQQGVEQIIASAQRAQAMLHTVLMLASEEKEQRHWSDTRLMITSVVELMQSILRRRKIQLQLELAPDLPPIWGEIAQLQQALLHLLHNAVAALETTPIERRLLLRGYAVNTMDREGICIELLDNGLGVPETLGNQIFEPFVSTRPAGAGAGLGLTVARAIIARAEGSLELLAPPDGGAGFRLTLPLRFPGSQR